jgi:GNAT superfamily N-acetyltransferase
LNISFFNVADAEELASVLEEMQAYYGVFCPSREAIVAGLLNRPEGTEILVARRDDIVGFTAFAAIYPGPGLQPGFFLKELYVANTERGKDTGAALMARLAALAVERGLSRIDWTASRTNEKLHRFYGRLGGEQKDDRIFYRLEGEKLQALAERG